jgi:hypothetical protein
MPKFKFILQREVTETDEVTRIIEADDLDAANTIAEEMCSEFDRSCPDDAQTIAGGECQDWFVNVGYEATPEESSRPCECFNCGWNGGESELGEIKDFHSRVEPGDTVVPAGECPECGCLAYLKEPDGADETGLNAALAPSEEELLDRAEQKHNAQMLDGCETEDEFNAELRAQTQGR